MFARLALLFIVVPFAELALLMWIAARVGFWPTMALVVLTGFVGAALARAAGVQVIGRIRQEIAAGRMPVDHLLDGLLVLIGGVLLLTPGILSDLFGLALLLPASRSVMRSLVRRRMQRLVDARRVQVVGLDGRPIN